jgi:predicted RecB family nuclease
MHGSVEITAAVFAAYLNCPTKAYLIAHGEDPPDAFVAVTRGRVSAAYKARAGQGLTVVVPIHFSRLSDDTVRDATTVFVDCETASYVCNDPASAWVDGRVKRSEPGRDFVSIRYSSWDKIDQFDDLLVCFGAVAIGQATGSRIPTNGKVIYGEGHRAKTVRVADYLTKWREVIEAIASICRTSEPPPLVLNKHCPVCEFKSRCRYLAVEQDHLSLLTAMTAKERMKCEEKGISTITQLSYGYRPRRRRRLKPAAVQGSQPVKHDHRLTALAIKNARIHVVGSPSLPIEGTPVFMDVEGMPDRDFYYLIGLRHETQGTYIEQSFWADAPEGEEDIWLKCLRALKQIDNPRILHYGAYETRFLKHMRERWTSPEDVAFVDCIVDGAVNLLSRMYGRIYFPTYSNGLKEIARWLGFEWTWAQASGGVALLLRRCWELTSDEEMRRKLITYNIEDCRAAEVVAGALVRICGNVEDIGTTGLETVNVSSLEVGFQRTFGKFPSALPEFERINAAAYWDYQRSKVYVRSNKALRRSLKNTVKPTRKIAVEKEVMVDDKPASCPRCGASKVWVLWRMSHVVFDLRSTYRGIKRWAIRYRYNSYRCGACKAEMTIHSGKITKYGENLRAYVAYLLIEMRLSNQKIRDHIATVFNIPMTTKTSHDIKIALAKKYEPTYRQILEHIASGPLVHADETKGVVYGGGHYVWIFANLTSVAYVYSASRDASILDEVLAGFNGVLVSDFYGGYDAVPCRQQKCLIHLMRDINEDVLKHPFNEEVTFVARRFGALLREVVETIDRYGLKKRYLSKHKLSAERFLDDVAGFQCVTEVGSALKKRIDKNKDKLFTFLEHDDVPWNNNNAEHAVRAFTRLRNVMVSSTPKGTREYCILLSVQQTLRYQGKSFLDFLRSGRIEID